MDLKKLSYDELLKLHDDPTTTMETRFDIYKEWDARGSCDRYCAQGTFYHESAIFTANDGVRWKSCGAIDYGNNNFFEVMVLEVKPPPSPSPFAGAPMDNFPVFFASHDEGLNTLGLSREEFFAQLHSSHFNSVVMQLGSLLSKYVEEE